MWLLLWTLTGCDDTLFGVPVGGPPDSGDEGYHPSDWSAPDQHGMAAKYQEDTCLSCHGSDLTGGSVGVSCDTCHEEGWRTDCTFCHGGTDNATGAPPVDISGESEAISFTPHTAHVTTNIHTAYDCVQCHQKPEDVLSVGHFLVSDDTPGEAEVDFSGGLSSAASYEGEASCADLYCHGDGQGNNGNASAGDDFSGCSDCHWDATSGEDRWDEMSGEHKEHLEEGFGCSECHALTVSDGQTLSDPSYHVNGAADVEPFNSAMSWSGGTCTGTCHEENHNSREWD